MGPLGVPELIIIFVVALVVFGPRKLPELGRSLGKSLSEFKRASNELRNTLDEEIQAEDRRAALRTTTTAAAAPVAASQTDYGAPDDDYDAGYPDTDPPQDDYRVGAAPQDESSSPTQGQAEDRDQEQGSVTAPAGALPETVARGQHG
jgi:sec-independent protein translocase protein TatA